MIKMPVSKQVFFFYLVSHYFIPLFISFDSASLLFIGHLFLIIIDIFLY
jgi:hypothetical protein